MMMRTLGRWRCPVALVLIAMTACRAGKDVAETKVKRANLHVAARSTPSAPTGAAASAQPVADDVAPLAEKTGKGGDIFRIGQPKLRLTSSSVDALQFSKAAELAVTADHDLTVAIWDTKTGTLLRRLENPDVVSNDFIQQFVLSPSGQWLAVSFNVRVFLFRYPFDTPPIKTPCYGVFAFSADENLLLCATVIPHVLDIRANKFIADVPKDRFKNREMSLGFSRDQRSIWWITSNKILRWDFATTGSITDVYNSSVPFERSSLSARADVALVEEGEVLYRVDLPSGTKTKLATIALANYAPSPTGKLFALEGSDQLRVVDMHSVKDALSINFKGSTGEIAFSEDDNVLAFVHDQLTGRGEGENAILQVLDLRAGLRTYEPPSRFAGWISGDTAAIEHKGAYSTLSATSSARGTTDAAAVAALALKPPAGAPPWAQWVSEGPDGKRIITEARPRSAAPPDQRYSIECEPTMRLWIPTAQKVDAKGVPAAPLQGREKVLKIACTDDDNGSERKDAGWFHGGGWIVGLSNKLATIYDSLGNKVAELSSGHPAFRKPEFRHEFWNLALSPTGKHLALLWRRADYGGDEMPTFDPREDAMHIAESIDRIKCQKNWLGECKMETFLEIWSLGRKPKRIWKERLSLPAHATRVFFEPKVPSGPITFDRTGQRVLVGFRNGDILIRSLSDKDPDIRGDKATGPLEAIHQVPITKIIVSPDNHWVFTEDASTEQRIWALPPM
jgi:WD40 repeat protein